MVQVRTRSERRSEKRQNLIFFAFIITITVVSFAVGVMVGRNTAPQPELARFESESGPSAGASDGDERGGAKKVDKLTFFETLPKGEPQPMGSGINLPPQEQAAANTVPQPAPVAVPEPKPQPVVPAPAPAPAPVETSKAKTIEERIEEVRVASVKPTPAKPASSGSGTYVLQVASFASPDEAGILHGRLTKKGYDTYVQQADLGNKGVWYRVFVGPVTPKAKAEAVAKRLEYEEKLKPLVRKK